MIRNTELEQKILSEFRKQKFWAVYFAGSFDEVYVGQGRNIGSRPIKLGLTSSLNDTISPTMNGASAFWPQGMIARVWLKGKATAAAVKGAVKARCERVYDPLRLEWIDMGEDFDETMFELEIRKAAEDLGYPCWDERELYNYLAVTVKNKSSDRMDRRSGVVGASKVA